MKFIGISGIISGGLSALTGFLSLPTAARFLGGSVALSLLSRVDTLSVSELCFFSLDQRSMFTWCSRVSGPWPNQTEIGFASAEDIRGLASQAAG